MGRRDFMGLRGESFIRRLDGLRRNKPPAEQGGEYHHRAVGYDHFPLMQLCNLVLLDLRCAEGIPAEEINDPAEAAHGIRQPRQPTAYRSGPLLDRHFGGYLCKVIRCTPGHRVPHRIPIERNPLHIAGKDVKEVATGIRPHLEKVKNEAYKQSEKLFKGIKVPSRNIEDALDAVHADARRGLGSKAKTEVLNRLDELGSKFHKNEVPIQDLIDAKIDVNKWAYTRDAEEAPYFKRVAKILKEAIQEEGSVNKEALKSFNQGEQLHQVLNSGKEVKQLIQENFDPKRFAKSKIIKSLFGLAGESVSLIPAGEATKFFIKRPEARNYYLNVMKSVVQENPAAAVNSLKQLVKSVDEYEDKTYKSAPKVEVLRGSKR